MTIDLETIPEEGLKLEGNLPAETLEMPEGDAQPAGPLTYRLRAMRFGDELLLTGDLEAPFTLVCGRTLHPFQQTIRLHDVALSIDVEGEEIVDPSEALREEILINLPSHPRCENGDEPGGCEIDPQYLAVDKTLESGVETRPATSDASPWDALDDIKAGGNPPETK